MTEFNHAIDPAEQGETSYERPELIAIDADQLVRNAGGPTYDPCACFCYQGS